jgi:hypothetical protein
VLVEPVLREALEPLGGHPDGALAVADVLAELLADDRHLLVDLGDPRAGRVVPVDAGAAEVRQRLVEQPGALGVERGRVEGGEHVVQLAVELQLGAELLHVLYGGLTAGADGLVGVHLAEQEPTDAALLMPIMPSSQMRSAWSGVVASPALSRSAASRAGLEARGTALVEPGGEVVGGGEVQGRGGLVKGLGARGDPPRCRRQTQRVIPCERRRRGVLGSQACQIQTARRT